MRISNLMYVGALSSLALVSCTNNDENSEWYGSEGIVFTTAIQSRVSGNAWNANDEVGIYMMNAGSGIEAATAQNKKYIAQPNGTLTAAPGNGIYLPETGSVDFIAYYPYTNSTNGNKLAVNVSDQSNPAAIDLIYSNGTKGIEAGSATTVSLGFTHQLTKVTLNVTKDETVETLNGLGVNMKGISTEGEFNLADGTLTATAGTNAKDVAMYVDAQGTTATATAIILPTAAASEQTAINLTFNLAGQSFTHTIDNTAIFEEGTNVSFNANLSMNNGKPVVTVGNATITDWTEKPGGDINVDFDGEEQPQPGEELFQESFGTPQKEGNYWPYFDAYTGFDNPATMFENTSAEKASVRIANDLTNVWFPAKKDVAIAVKGINAQGNTTATLEVELGANVYNAGESQDLNTMKIVCGGQEVTVPSKVVSGDNKEGNVPFKMTFENVTVSNDTRIEFSSNTTTNLYGLRLYSVKLYVSGNGSTDPDPEPEPTPGANLLINPGFEDWTSTLPTAWDNSKYNTGEIVKETTIKREGNNSLRQTAASGTNKIQQEVAITGGKKYRISYWFLDNDTKACSRYWFAIVDSSNKTITDLNDQLQQTDYSADNAEWQNVQIEFTAPTNAAKLRYEVRTYRNMDTNEAGGYIYYDDMKLEEVN